MLFVAVVYLSSLSGLNWTSLLGLCNPSGLEYLPANGRRPEGLGRMTDAKRGVWLDFGGVPSFFVVRRIPTALNENPGNAVASNQRAHGGADRTMNNDAARLSLNSNDNTLQAFVIPARSLYSYL
jgi:hypothetical protein